MYSIVCRRAFLVTHVDFSIHLYGSYTALYHSVFECLTRYSSHHMPLLYLFFRSYDICVSVSWLLTIPLCGVSGVLKVVSYFTSLMNLWVVLVIISGWEILRVVLVRSRLIAHLMNSYSSPIDKVTYYFLMYSSVFIDARLSLISIVAYTYTMIIIVLGSFNLYKKTSIILDFFKSWLESYCLGIFLEP